MYRQEIYLRSRQAELKSIMQGQLRGCLAVSPNNNPFYYPANLLLGFGSQLIAELSGKKDKSVQEFVYLLVALKLTGQSYHPQLSEFKQAYPEVDHGENIDRLFDYFANSEQKAEPKDTKEHLRRKYELLLGKA
jgi:hypothetical protein